MALKVRLAKNRRNNWFPGVLRTFLAGFLVQHGQLNSIKVKSVDVRQGPNFSLIKSASKKHHDNIKITSGFIPNRLQADPLKFKP